MGSIPRTLSDFKITVDGNLRENLDSLDYSNSPHLKIQLIESNIESIPQINKFTEWKPFEDTHHWYCCNNGSDFIVANKFSSRVWGIYSLMKVEAFTKIADKWIKDSLNLDKCWIPSTRIRTIGKSNSWLERGIGIKYHDVLSDENTQGKVSLKAWYGHNETLLKALDILQDNFAISSYRFKDESTSSVSEWYSTGKITFNASENCESALESLFIMMKYYDEELKRATKLRDESRGSFEFEFNQNIDLKNYSEYVSKGKGDLQLWMTEIESSHDFKRFRGVDMHTWDRVFLDLGNNFAYMTIPGHGCVNAAPRFITIQGETISGKTRVYYNGDEIFV